MANNLQNTGNGTRMGRQRDENIFVVGKNIVQESSQSLSPVLVRLSRLRVIQQVVF